MVETVTAFAYISFPENLQERLSGQTFIGQRMQRIFWHLKFAPRTSEACLTNHNTIKQNIQMIRLCVDEMGISDIGRPGSGKCQTKGHMLEMKIGVTDEALALSRKRDWKPSIINFLLCFDRVILLKLRKVPFDMNFTPQQRAKRWNRGRILCLNKIGFCEGIGNCKPLFAIFKQGIGIWTAMFTYVL